MDEKEIRDYLKKHLAIKIDKRYNGRCTGPAKRIDVALLLDGEEITSDFIYLS